MKKSIRLLVGTIVAIILALGLAIPAFAAGPTHVDVGFNGQGNINGSVNSNGAKASFNVNGPSTSEADFYGDVHIGPWGGTVIDSGLSAGASSGQHQRANITYRVNNDNINGAGVRVGATNGYVGVYGNSTTRTNSNAGCLTWYGTQFFVPDAYAESGSQNVVMNSYDWNQGYGFTDTSFLPYSNHDDSTDFGNRVVNADHYPYLAMQVQDSNTNWGLNSTTEFNGALKGAGTFNTFASDGLNVTFAGQMYTNKHNVTTIEEYLAKVNSSNSNWYWGP